VVNATGALLGIVTSSDYATKDEGIPFSIIRAPQLFGQWLPPGGIEEVYRTARATPIRSLMQPGVVTCDESASLDDVVRMFVDRNVHHVVVARERKPVGIVARHDLLRAMARAMEAVA
jgi:CBS-domain-containing membrane protein